MKTIRVTEVLTGQIGTQIKQQIETETETEDCQVIIDTSLVTSKDLRKFLETNFKQGDYTVTLTNDIFSINFGSLASSK